jgi:hypothetical protein
MNETHRLIPEREEVRFESVRHGGSTLRLCSTCWSDHETATITLSSNGKNLHIAVQPREVPDLIDALSALRDERGWK